MLHVSVLFDHSVRKCALLNLVWCYKPTGDREQDLWRYWLPECCIKQGYDKPMGEGCLCKKCERRDQWISDILVSCTLSKCTDMQYANTSFRNILDSHHWPDSPFRQQKTFCFLYCFSGVWAFCQAVLLFTYIVATKIGSCFITPNFLPNCLTIMDALSIF